MAEQETSAAQKKAEAAAPEKVVKAGKDWVARVKEAKQAGAGRKFEQTWDFVINLKGLDLKRPENRFSSEVVLPEGRGKELKVAVISDALTAEAKDSKQAKRIANEYDWFLGEVALMAQIGKTLGMVMGPRGKMPKPVPPKAS